MRSLLITALVPALALAACTSGGDSEDSSTTSVAAETSTTAAPDDSTAPETTTTAMDEATTSTGAPDESTTTEGATAGGGGDDCLVGTWLLDDDLFVENFGSVMADAGMPDAEVSALGGTFQVEMNGDGTYDAVREGWGFSIATAEGTVTLEINGTETGNWSTAGDTLMIDGDVSDLTVDTSVEVDGQEIPIPESQVPVDTPPGIATDSTFTCSGDTMTLTNAGVESVLTRA